MDLRPHICKQCGGHIDLATMKCAYCGTTYSDPALRNITFKVDRPGVQRIRTQITIPNDRMKQSPEAARDYALRELRNQLADGLLAFMKIDTAEDFMNDAQIIRGEVRVLEPSFDNCW